MVMVPGPSSLNFRLKLGSSFGKIDLKFTHRKMPKLLTKIVKAQLKPLNLLFRFELYFGHERTSQWAIFDDNPAKKSSGTRRVQW